MWFWLSLTALFFWSGSDLFSKIGSRPDDKYSHCKMIMAVGLIMGIHAAFELIVKKTPFSFSVIIAYLPVSFLYIFSMLLGYIALRYTELSISSPICNSSGAFAAILCFSFLNIEYNTAQIIGVILVASGIIALGFAEMKESDKARQIRQKKAKIQYQKTFIGILLPVLYCLIDAFGTFFDSSVLREDPTGTVLDIIFPTPLEESAANIAYELTFFMMAVAATIYVLIIKKQKLSIRREGPKLIGGLFETAGQFAYIFALGDTQHSGFAAAIISAYCAVSVLWSRIFLKEKLSYKHYLSIFIALIGIVILGLYDI